MRINMLLLIVSILIITVIPSDMTDASEIFTAIVKEVRDGDTIILKEPIKGKKVVRLLGIDTPETFWTDGIASGNQVIPHGLAAAKKMKELLPAGSEVQLVMGKWEIDPYGRLLAYVYKDGVDLNQLMLKNGLAVTFFIWPFEEGRFESYQKEMAHARKNQLGVWNPIDPLEEWPFEYRARVREKRISFLIGDIKDRHYEGEHSRYKRIPMTRRVYFLKENDAELAGYTRKKKS